MPMWVDGPDGTPYRPWGAVWVSLETGLVNMKLAEFNGDPGPLALDAMLELGFRFAQTRPSAIQVADKALGEQIAPRPRRRAPDRDRRVPSRRGQDGGAADGGRDEPEPASGGARCQGRDDGAHAGVRRRGARLLRRGAVASPERRGSDPGGGAESGRGIPSPDGPRTRRSDIRAGVLRLSGGIRKAARLPRPRNVSGGRRGAGSSSSGRPGRHRFPTSTSGRSRASPWPGPRPIRWRRGSVHRIGCAARMRAS